MIQKFIKDPETKKRWKRLVSRRRSRWAAYCFFFTLFLAVTAEFWANSKPIVIKYKGEMYLPVWKTHHPTVFEQTESMVTDYRQLQLGDGDWAIWPLIQWDPFESNAELEHYPGGPSKKNLFGTDDRGRDVLTRLLYGFRYSIAYALLVWFFSYLVGTLFGAVMGYLGGWTDMVGQRVVEVFEVIPGLPLLLLLVTVFGSSLSMLVIFSVLMGWMMISIYMRGEFLRLRNRDFVESARALGVPWYRVVFKHILPNAMGPIVTFSPFAISGGIAGLAVLDYLGFGLPPPTPSWGELLNQGQKYFEIAWWLAVYPSVALFFSVASLNLIGEGVRDAFDPRK